MPRRGRSATIGKFVKIHQERRAYEIQKLGELLRREQRARLVQAVLPPRQPAHASAH